MGNPMIKDLIKRELHPVIKACPRFNVEKAEAKLFAKRQPDGSALKITLWLSFPDGMVQGTRALIPFITKLGALRDWAELFLEE